MNFQLLFFFIGLNIINVIIQTVKSIATIKCGKAVAALVNAVAYGLYTVVIVYTNADLDLWIKVVVVAVANLVGVYVVKFFEEKSRKDKLWKIEATVYDVYTESLHNDLNKSEIPHNYIANVGKYSVFNIYCATQEESARVKRLLEYHKAKFFVSEAKTSVL
jgi:uncharacterized protein YebE (UPF0316 family)